MKATVTHDPFGDVHDDSTHLNDSPDRSNGWATASLGLALLSWTVGWLICCVPVFFSLPAVITGHVAQRPSFPTSRLTLMGINPRVLEYSRNDMLVDLLGDTSRDSTP